MSDFFQRVFGNVRGSARADADEVWAQLEMVSATGWSVNLRLSGPGSAVVFVLPAASWRKGARERILMVMPYSRLRDWPRADLRFETVNTWLPAATMAHARAFARTARAGDRLRLYSHPSFRPKLDLTANPGAPAARWPVGIHIQLPDGELGVIASQPDTDGCVDVRFPTALGREDSEPVSVSQSALTPTRLRRGATYFNECELADAGAA